MLTLDIKKIDWKKMQGLLPVIVQDAKTNAVLMLGYMDEEALQRTLTSKLVTFYSRSRNEYWVKGETSGNKLELENVLVDCDNDTLLIFANPTGPVCHTGMTTCFGEPAVNNLQVLQKLEATLKSREQSRPEGSYSTQLFNAGVSRIAQKVGEEGVEVALAALDKNDAELCGEIADLFFHALVLLRARNLNLDDVMQVLRERTK